MDNPYLWSDALMAGSFFSLIALAYYITRAGTGFFNFALGSFAMIAAVFAGWLQATHGVVAQVAALIAIASVVGLSLLSEIVVVRPVQRRERGSDLPSLVAVAGLLFLLQQLAGIVFGYQRFQGTSLVGFGSVSFGSFQVPTWALVLIIATPIVFLLSSLWVARTKSGRILRAVGGNLEAAKTLGLPVGKIRLISFAASGFIVALAGILYSSHAGATSRSGLEWALVGFLAFVIGGTGNVWAPFVGGLLLGLAQVFVTFYLGGAVYSYALLGLAIVFFAIRPQGLFFRKVRI